jgi:hypothetical protein
MKEQNVSMFVHHLQIYMLIHSLKIVFLTAIKMEQLTLTLIQLIELVKDLVCLYFSTITVVLSIVLMVFMPTQMEIVFDLSIVMQVSMLITEQLNASIHVSLVHSQILTQNIVLQFALKVGMEILMCAFKIVQHLTHHLQILHKFAQQYAQIIHTAKIGLVELNVCMVMQMMNYKHVHQVVQLTFMQTHLLILALIFVMIVKQMILMIGLEILILDFV